MSNQRIGMSAVRLGAGSGLNLFRIRRLAFGSTSTLVCGTSIPLPEHRMKGCLPNVKLEQRRDRMHRSCLLHSTAVLVMHSYCPTIGFSPRWGARFFSTATQKNTSFTSRQNVPDAILIVRDLLDEQRYPIGSFTPELYQKAKAVLFIFFSDRGGALQASFGSSEVVNAPLLLIERLVREMAIAADTSAVYYRWLLSPRYFNPFVHKWKDFSLRGCNTAGLVPALELLEKFQTMSTLLPTFQYDIRTLTMILHVAIQQAGPGEAPLVAERILAWMHDECQNKSSRTDPWDTLAPNEFTYNLVLKAWADSRLPEAAEKLEAVVEDMRRRHIALGNVSYSILMRFWSHVGNVEQVEALLETMATEGVVANAGCLLQALYCCAIAGQTQNAEEVLRSILLLRRDSYDRDSEVDWQNVHDDFTRVVGEGVQHILKAYRKVVETKQFTMGNVDRKNPDVNHAVESAALLVQSIEQSKVLDPVSLDKLHWTMMDIYARAGMISDAETMFKSQESKSLASYGMLIKAYGNCDSAHEASRLLHELLEDATIRPNIDVFNMVIDAWAKSSSVDAVRQAFNVWEFLNRDAKCLELRIRPDVITYGSMLKCLVAPNAPNEAGSIAEGILNDMERSYNAGDARVKPDEIVYTLVMRAWFQSGDPERAAAVLKRMEASNTPPDTRIYNDMLRYYAHDPRQSSHCSLGAETAQQLLKTMKATSSAPPSVYSYSLVATAWIRSGSPVANEQVWNLYQDMRHHNINLDKFMYLQLIQCLCNSKRHKDVDRADFILRSMERHCPKDLIPDHFFLVLKSFCAIDNAEGATRVMMRFAQTFGNIDGPFPALIHRLVELWLRSDMVHQATIMVATLEAILLEKGNPQQRPAPETLQVLLSAWTLSHQMDKELHISMLREKIAALTASEKSDGTE